MARSTLYVVLACALIGCALAERGLKTSQCSQYTGEYSCNTASGCAWGTNWQRASGKCYDVAVIVTLPEVVCLKLGINLHLLDIVKAQNILVPISNKCGRYIDGNTCSGASGCNWLTSSTRGISNCFDVELNACLVNLLNLKVDLSFGGLIPVGGTTCSQHTGEYGCNTAAGCAWGTNWKGASGKCYDIKVAVTLLDVVCIKLGLNLNLLESVINNNIVVPAKNKCAQCTDGKVCGTTSGCNWLISPERGIANCYDVKLNVCLVNILKLGLDVNLDGVIDTLLGTVVGTVGGVVSLLG